MAIPSALILGLTPHIINLLNSAIKGISILNNPDATVEDVRVFRNETLASEKELEDLIAKAVEEEGPAT